MAETYNHAYHPTGPDHMIQMGNPPAVIPPSYRKREKRVVKQKCSVVTCILLTVGILILLMVPPFVYFFIYKSPHIVMQYFTMPEFHVTGRNSSPLAAKWDVTLGLTNPSAVMRLYFHGIQTKLKYRGQLIDVHRLPNVKLESRKWITVNPIFSFPSNNSQTFPAWTRDMIQEKQKRRAIDGFEVQTTTNVDMIAGGFTIWTKKMDVPCEFIEVKIGADGEGGAMVGNPFYCNLAFWL